MSDMITAEEAQKLLDDLLSGGPFPYRDDISDAYSTVIALHAQLADAKAAQAMVVRKAAEACEDVDFAHDDPSIQRMVREVIGFAGSRVRALADADGLAMAQELRAERDQALEWNAQANVRAEKAEDERDRLAAEKAELEARVEKLVGAVEYIAGASEEDGREPGKWAINHARAALSNLTPTPSDTDGPIWHERLGWDGNKEGEG